MWNILFKIIISIIIFFNNSFAKCNIAALLAGETAI